LYSICFTRTGSASASTGDSTTVSMRILREAITLSSIASVSSSISPRSTRCGLSSSAPASMRDRSSTSSISCSNRRPPARISASDCRYCGLSGVTSPSRMSSAKPMMALSGGAQLV